VKTETAPIISAVIGPAKVAAMRCNVPICSSLLLSTGDGSLSVTGTNLDTYVVSRAPCASPLSPICVRADHLLAALRGVGESVEFDIDIKAKRLIVDGHCTCKLPYLSAEEFPAMPELPKKAVGLNCADLVRGIKAVLWSVLDGLEAGSQPVYGCVHVLATAKQIACAGYNRRSFALCRVASIAAGTEFLLPRAFARLVCDALESPGAVLSVSDSWCSVAHDSGSVAVKLAEGRFVNYEKLIGIKQEVGKVQAGRMLEPLKTASQLADPGITAIELKFDGVGVALEMIDKLNGFRSALGGEFKKERIKFDVHRLAELFGTFEESEDVTMSTLEQQPGFAFVAGERTVLLSPLTEPKKSS
jgi:DNA polymerase III sliding clamp (beta) subunit (PCNA family)